MLKREYVHLSLSERDLITTMLAEEKSLGEIAKALGRSKSTVSRELRRNATPASRLYMSHPDTENRQELIQCLRRAHRKRRNKGIGRKERKTKIPNRVPIDQRPQAVESRTQFGHWEGDSLVSRKRHTRINSVV